MSFRFATQTVQMSMQYIQYEIIIAIKKTTLPPTGSWENWAYKTEYIQIDNQWQSIDYYVRVVITEEQF